MNDKITETSVWRNLLDKFLEQVHRNAIIQYL